MSLFDAAAVWCDGHGDWGSLLLGDRLATFGVGPTPMMVDEFGKFYRDDVMAIVKLAKDINLVSIN